jgi:O-methyltransferase
VRLAAARAQKRIVRFIPRALRVQLHGLRAVARQESSSFPPDFGAKDIALIRAVRGYTMTSPERIVALRHAVCYIVRNRVPGAIVECGVWKGGSMMAVAYTLLDLDVADRALYLFDTFDGMTPPTSQDVSYLGTAAGDAMARNPDVIARAALESVRQAMQLTGYPERGVHYVKGAVEETIPDAAPDEIALLRLDTDWYASTFHEWVHLYPRLARGGVIIVDDYGHWRGARQATDEYLATLASPPLLVRVDYTARMGVKAVSGSL